MAKAERDFGIDNLFDHSNVMLNHHITQALKAHVIMKRDVDYVVQEGEVVIVDEFTGRLMTGRRYSDGLHQAIEAKENLQIQNESMTLATITFQNYFRMYQKLAGMTGTAKTEEEEFKKIYDLEVVVDSDEPPDDPRRYAGCRLQDGRKQIPHSGRGDRDAPCRKPAGARRHGVDRNSERSRRC